VLNWIRQGKVGASPRYVNLIHVEDLAAICVLALERGRAGEAYNVSDGRPRRWSDICDYAFRRWNISAADLVDDEHHGKRISIEKLQAELDYTFRHPDLYTALDAIESASAP
jgi:nucleoside-diphosphate-sugar epimerase